MRTKAPRRAPWVVLLALLLCALSAGTLVAQNVPQQVPALDLVRQTYPKVCLASNLRLKSTAQVTREQCALVKAKIDSLNDRIALLNRTVILVPAPTVSHAGVEHAVARVDRAALRPRHGGPDARPHRHGEDGDGHHGHGADDPLELLSHD
jgi:hypothetical protein